MAGLSTGCNALQQVMVSFMKPLVLYAQPSQGAADVVDLLKQQDNQIQKTLLFALIPVVVAFSFVVFVFYELNENKKLPTNGYVFFCNYRVFLTKPKKIYYE
jgi:undecaprenyl pyrophosphate phosphatase UppP